MAANTPACVWRIEHDKHICMYVVPSRFSNNSEAKASELLENLEDVLLIVDCGSQTSYFYYKNIHHTMVLYGWSWYTFCHDVM